MELRLYAWNALNTIRGFILFTVFATSRYTIDTSFYKRTDVSIVLIDLYMSKAKNSVTIVTNKFIYRFWKTDIGIKIVIEET